MFDVINVILNDYVMMYMHMYMYGMEHFHFAVAQNYVCNYMYMYMYVSSLSAPIHILILSKLYFGGI